MERSIGGAWRSCFGAWLGVAVSGALAPLARAQVTEVAAMTLPASVIDMDAAGSAGPVTLAAIVAAGTGGGASLLEGVVLTPNGQAGVYNVNTQLGTALALDPVSSGLALVAPQGAFDAFEAQVDLLIPMTEFGIAIGDWTLGMSLEFFDQGSSVGSIQSSPYTAGGVKFFQSVTPFRRVVVRTPFGAGNWVITEMHVQSGMPTTASNTPVGSGCGGLGLAGVTRPVIGTSWDLSLTGIPPSGLLGAEVFGLSDAGIDDLVGIGLPGCGLRASLDFVRPFSVSGGTHTAALVLPVNVSFVGLHVFATCAVLESPPSNPFGAITGNAIDGLVGDV